MDPSSIAKLVAILVLVVFSAYFSATETAFTSLNRIRLKSRAEAGDRRAASTLALADDYDRLLSTILIGNNVVNNASTSLATLLFISLLGEAQGPAVATLVVTIVILIFGEISPKSMAKEFPEQFAMFSAPFLRLLMALLRPLTFLAAQWKKFLSLIIRKQGNAGITEEELITMVSEAENEGGLDQDESALIRSAIEFSDLEVEEILTPRVDIVAAEDTRRLYALANRLGVHVNGRVVAYHDHNERDKSDGLLDQVETGATVLVVSDAGMPTINDPGLAIVRRAIERGLPVTCAPGPSAVLDALCLSGLPTDRFCYEGFLPRKHSERVQYLRTLRSERRTIVFYETLHRIDDSMADLLDVFGPNRKMALCRELTKDFEQIRRGTIAQIRQSVIDEPPRGEMVLVVAGASEEEADAAAPASLSVEDLAVLSIDRAQEDNLRIKDAISQVVAEHPLADGSLANRKQVYNAVLAMKQ